jgi:hypothetical protein
MWNHSLQNCDLDIMVIYILSWLSACTVIILNEYNNRQTSNLLKEVKRHVKRYPVAT